MKQNESLQYPDISYKVKRLHIWFGGGQSVFWKHNGLFWKKWIISKKKKKMVQFLEGSLHQQEWIVAVVYTNSNNRNELSL